jgi:hypothetical protein
VVQFKYGNTWQLHYKVGEELQWGGNDVGEQGRSDVVVDGIVETQCSNCGYGGPWFHEKAEGSGWRAGEEWNVYVRVEHDRITCVENANGRFNFAKLGSNYIIVS